MLREPLERWGLQFYLKLSDLSKISGSGLYLRDLDSAIRNRTKNQGSNSEMSSPDNFTTEDPSTFLGEALTSELWLTTSPVGF